ncbi:DUF2795 domain-containing protein [Streptomyces sp. URMC 123]|uniref:DUF2795 domain-containing protein n=1 Tax=Streptomyces sp. URMC 123 TaxID=3423403 RepID=UPI003F1CBCA6
MTQHGRDKIGPVRDDELKQELQGELRANRALRAHEQQELQPSGEDQPEVSRAPNASFPGSVPPGMSPELTVVRTELARHLERGIYPARRDAVLKTLRRHNAPDRLLDLAERLPADAEFTNVQDIVRALS